MGNPSKATKRAKISNQIAELLAKLTELDDRSAPKDFGDWMNKRQTINTAFEMGNQKINIKKKIAFLERKLDALEDK